jgi:hypothetical protein
VNLGDDLLFPRPLLHQRRQRHLTFAVGLKENARIPLRSEADVHADAHLGVCHALADDQIRRDA